jgi:hypothetical protein
MSKVLDFLLLHRIFAFPLEFVAIFIIIFFIWMESKYCIRLLCLIIRYEVVNCFFN